MVALPLLGKAPVTLAGLLFTGLGVPMAFCGRGMRERKEDGRKEGKEGSRKGGAGRPVC